MSNYDVDELERRRDMENRMTATTTKGKVIQPESQAALTLELPDDVIFNLSMLAHERGITLNKMIHITLKKGLSIVDNTLKTTSPQLLVEKGQ
jgi:putative heme iron utilization protein|tara:strand:+ start:1150 stop:1428 length:279 start_codon:yes stop_codon:yes gene_type:complete